MSPYHQRLIDPLITQLLTELPALALVGPRASGKTTTASRHVESIVRLDRPAEAAAFEADPDSALRGLAEPVLLDEWQKVPEVLGAVKRAVDASPRPGRFVLTGSVHADLAVDTWPGIGRLVRLPLLPMTVSEQIGSATTPLVDRVTSDDELASASDPPDLRGYVELAVRSGFPQPALEMSDLAHTKWLESYLDQLITRDLKAVGERRDPGRLRRFLESYALNSAGVVDDKTVYETAGINRKTAVAYEGLLANLMVVESLPAWSSNRLKRMVRSPKRYVIDSGLVAGALGLGVEDFMRDGDLLGRLLDTFVAAQLRAETSISTYGPRWHHLRKQEGEHEIDLIAELTGRTVIGVEIKATAAPKRRDARHLIWLRDQLDEHFSAGVLLHTGPASFQIDDRIVAAPICTLWSDR